MQTYLFLLGTTHKLSFEELSAVLTARKIKITKHTDEYASCQASQEDIEPEKLIRILGGTVKIAKKISNSTENIVGSISNVLMSLEGRITFAVHASGDENIHGQVKAILAKEGKSVRFVHIETSRETAYHQNKTVYEFFVHTREGFEGIYQVVAAQDIKEWKKRDYDRPWVDPKSGMLPPKVARMMVNIAIPDQSVGRIYDPFCGSGTILAEAMMLGHDVIGSDVSSRAILDSQENIEWLKAEYGLENSVHIFKQDAAHVTSQDVFSKSIDAIVYEPYMGPSQMREEKVADIARGLQKLYIGALKNIGKLLKSGAKVVAIFPQITVGSVVKNTDNLIDRCGDFGYTRRGGPIEYSRPNSVVVRKIYILEKN